MEYIIVFLYTSQTLFQNLASSLLNSRSSWIHLWMFVREARGAFGLEQLKLPLNHDAASPRKTEESAT